MIRPITRGLLLSGALAAHPKNEQHVTNRLFSSSPTSSLRLHYGLGGYSHREDGFKHPKNLCPTDLKPNNSGIKVSTRVCDSNRHSGATPIGSASRAPYELFDCDPSDQHAKTF